MDEREAQEVTRMVESGWSCDFGATGRMLWCRMLYPFDAELATNAVVEMSKFPLPDNRFKPQVSDLRAVIIAIRNRTRPPDSIAVEGKRGTATPEWVWVWSWARFMRDPVVERAFPQQDGFADPVDMMSRAEYEELLAEWKKAGSPRSSNPLPAALR